MVARLTIAVEPLSREAFSRFGDVIEAHPCAMRRLINRGNAERFEDVARIDTLKGQGRTCISVVRVQPYALPFNVTLLERHRRGSQAFVPWSGLPFLAIVAVGAKESLQPQDLRCFLCGPHQGVNYAPGTWHHPVFAMGQPSDFLVIDRAAAEDETDCEEIELDVGQVWVEGVG
jgi:ureidoglycolate lyase